MDHFVYAPRQLDMTLQCNIISHWLGTCTKWSLEAAAIAIVVDIINDTGIPPFNTLRPRQNGHHVPEDIFKCSFLKENVWISLTISLKFVFKVRINNIPALVQIMAWRQPGNKPLSGPMIQTFNFVQSDLYFTIGHCRAVYKMLLFTPYHNGPPLHFNIDILIIVNLYDMLKLDTTIINTWCRFFQHKAVLVLLSWLHIHLLATNNRCDFLYTILDYMV